MCVGDNTNRAQKNTCHNKRRLARKIPEFRSHTLMASGQLYHNNTNEAKVVESFLKPISAMLLVITGLSPLTDLV